MTVIVAASREELTSQMVQSRHSQREKSLTAYSAFHDKFQQCKETNLVGGLQIYKVGAESPPSVRISDASSSTSNESEVKLSLSGPSIGTYQIESRHQRLSVSSIPKSRKSSNVPHIHSRIAEPKRSSVTSANNVWVFAVPNDDDDYPSSSYINVTYQDITHLLQNLRFEDTAGNFVFGILSEHMV
ncbi:uncharacterized protein LOC142358366 [Convolutriloba macropyga]|uniref:uncharacterized protein LOC142358366 n=1 Tax=Convolutriloba macropyga TaxID=536237 RepID=UPI003F52158E